jgi:mannose-6-phosphate isomerase-like protein (cupin superfamily)
MTEQIQLIAERIKGLRELSRTSIETLSANMDILPETLQEYESGTADIPVGFLHKLAQKYEIEFSTLLSGENPRLHLFCVVRKGKGLIVERRKQYHYETLAANFIHKKADPFIVFIEAESENQPLEFNSHPGQEFDYVLEGTMKIVVDNHEMILNEGDSIYYDSGYQHAMKAVNGKPVKFLAVIV